MNQDCLCGHARVRHDRNIAGVHAGKCRAPLCGCGTYRPRPDISVPAPREERAA